MTGAVFTDLYKDKIYNVWVIPGILTGLILALCQGMDRFWQALLSIGVTFLILIPVYLIKGIAAGDVKLLLATSSFLSLQDTYSCILYSFLIAGLISLGMLFLKHGNKKTLHFALPVLASTVFVLGGIV